VIGVVVDIVTVMTDDIAEKGIGGSGSGYCLYFLLGQ